MMLLISLSAHAPVFLICTLFLDACCGDEGSQVQSQLLLSLKQITLPLIPKLKVLINILADARGWPIKVVCEMILDWIADPVVDNIPSDSVWFVDDESMDTDKDDEIDELLDNTDTE
ncbi:hypothetical protein EDC04DRAFT_2607291 [Pisolithus marmoratus]|nr:hypothetical protein EDC04DRAFT_2607291 [Pisolithus marmoratus]